MESKFKTEEDYRACSTLLKVVTSFVSGMAAMLILCTIGYRARLQNINKQEAELKVKAAAVDQLYDFMSSHSTNKLRIFRPSTNSAR